MRALHEAQRTQMTQEMTAKLRRPKPSRVRRRRVASALKEAAREHARVLRRGSPHCCPPCLAPAPSTCASCILGTCAPSRPLPKHVASVSRIRRSG